MAYGNVTASRYQGFQAKMNGKAIAASANIALPEKIRCCQCRKVKPPTSYSDKRQQELKNEIRRAMASGRAFDAVQTEHVSCSMCTAGQVTELECTGCDKWLGKDNFAKTQHRNPDNALCYRCSEDRQNMMPTTEGHSDDSYSSDGSGGTDDSYGSNLYSDVNSVATGLSQASISNTTDASTGYPRGGGVPLPSNASSVKGTIFNPSAVGSRLASTYSGMSSSRPSLASTVGAASNANSSAVSTTSTDRPVFNKNKYGTPRRLSPTGSTVTNNGAFPKIRSGPKKVESDMARRQREREASDDETRVSSDADSD